ncbi:hypothetical protein JYG23_12340 [Sedimentibacter sp. zth1]|uniref:hypothetical protein n=1 Tax=Sedimentibacter sp. zth1 TaxID=2816908 RepID=UPI001A921255|nr:hypothetical protein [Sedimentibacter sp. zth1]QSX05457.1 hypothetical protein JYG23_12340 [Sedimentibacter sp. zth1]
MLNNSFTFDAFTNLTDTVTTVIVCIAFMVSIITAGIAAYLNKKDSDKRADYMTEIIWTIVISFVIGASVTIVKLIFGI